MSDTPPRIGFVGTPGHGLRGALTLRELGLDVTICCEDEELSDVPSPAEVAGRAEVVLIEASDADGVDAILFSVMGLASGAPTPRVDKPEDDLTAVVLTAMEPEQTDGAAERLAGYGVTLVYAPLEGEEVAGLDADDDTAARLAPLLAAAGLVKAEG